MALTDLPWAMDLAIGTATGQVATDSVKMVSVKRSQLVVIMNDNENK